MRLRISKTRKTIAFALAAVMFCSLLPYLGGSVCGAGRGHGDDCDHACADHPVGGLYQPGFDIEEAPAVSEKEIEAANRKGEFFAFAQDGEQKRKAEKPARSGAKSGAGSGAESAVERLENTIYDSPDDAIADVRQALVEGDEGGSGINLKIRIALDYWNDTDFSSPAVWNEFFGSEEWYDYNVDGLAVLNKATAYTGKPREGDYLVFRHSGGSFGFGFPNHGYYAPDGSGRAYMEWRHTVVQFTNRSQEQYVDDRVDEVLEDLEIDGKSDLEKIKAIYGWVSTEVDYDFENLNDPNHGLKYTAYAALRDGKSVCQGYATLFYRMMSEAGLPCRVVSGDNHAWNAVRIGDRWYYVDSTWDIGYDEVGWNYFLKGRNDFEDHTPENKSGCNFTHDPENPDWLDYKYADDAWYVKYPIPAGRYYPDSTDPDCVHAWNDGVVIQQKKCTQPELTEKTCASCGAKDVVITKTGSPHVGKTETFTEVDATCTKPGGFRALCANCNEYYVIENPNLKPALGHDYGACLPLHETDPDYGKKHVRVCARDSSHVLKERHAWDDGVVTVEPTETREGLRTFTCGACGLTRTEPISPIPHTHQWGAPTYTWNGGNASVTAIRVCTKNASHRETETAKATVTVTRNATCTADGERKYTASFENTAFETQTKTESIPATGHSWDGGVVTVEPTETREGVRTFTCGACNVTREETIPRLEDPTGTTEPTTTTNPTTPTGTTKPVNPTTSAKPPSTTKPIRIASKPGSSKPPRPTADPAKQMGADGTALGRGASLMAANKAITSMKKDADPAGSRYAPLMVKQGKVKKTSVGIKWNKVPGARRYIVYGNASGNANRMTKLTATTGKSVAFAKIAGKKVKKAKYYKFIVVAVDGRDNVVASSTVTHIATSGGKVSNAKKVTVKARVGKKTKSVSKVKVKPGKSLKLKAKAAAPKGKKLKTYAKIRYESSDPALAAVSKSGTIKAGKARKGSCTIYVYAQNGKVKSIKVTVK